MTLGYLCRSNRGDSMNPFEEKVIKLPVLLNPWDSRNLFQFSKWNNDRWWHLSTSGKKLTCDGEQHMDPCPWDRHTFMSFSCLHHQKPHQELCIFLLNAYFIWMQIFLQLPYRRLPMSCAVSRELALWRRENIHILTSYPRRTKKTAWEIRCH